jgi:MarR family transcriptional regulator, negative regulator of the multidrug operon emrRAB
MSEDPLITIEQDIASIARRHIDFPVELSMVLHLVKRFGWHMACSADALLKTWGITYVEYGLLVALYGRPNQSVSVAELCNVIGEAPQHVRRLTLALSRRGLVVRTRDAAGRRKAVVGLSDDGVALVQSMLPVISSMAAGCVDSFAAGELTRLLGLLKKLMRGTRGF